MMSNLKGCNRRGEIYEKTSKNTNTPAAEDSVVEDTELGVAELIGVAAVVGATAKLTGDKLFT
jgi:hypothetical protein